MWLRLKADHIAYSSENVEIIYPVLPFCLKISRYGFWSVPFNPKYNDIHGGDTKTPRRKPAKSKKDRRYGLTHCSRQPKQ